MKPTLFPTPYSLSFVILASVTPDVVPIFQEEYRALRPRAPMPPIHVRFRRFTSLNTTIRLREGKIFVKPLRPARRRAGASSTPSRTSFSPSSIASPSAPRTTSATSASPPAPPSRTRPNSSAQRAAASATPDPKAATTISKKSSTRLNTRFFGGLLGRPELTWSEHNAKRSLGHYDAAHNTIVVSRVFDRPSSPRYAIEYLLYHEMLHLKHPVKIARPAPLRPLPRIQSGRGTLPATGQALAFIKRL